MLSLALSWGKTRSPAGLASLAVIYGLSLTHHRSMLLFAPPLLVYVWWYERSALWRKWRRLLGLTFWCLAPLLLYLYLPWAEARNLPPGTWRPQTLSAWLGYFRDSGFTGLVTVDTHDLGQRLVLTADPRPRLRMAGALLGLTGVAWLLLRHRPEAVFLIAAFVLQVVLAANYRVPCAWVFFLPLSSSSSSGLAADLGWLAGCGTAGQPSELRGDYHRAGCSCGHNAALPAACYASPLPPSA